MAVLVLGAAGFAVALLQRDGELGKNVVIGTVGGLALLRVAIHLIGR